MSWPVIAQLQSTASNWSARLLLRPDRRLILGRWSQPAWARQLSQDLDRLAGLDPYLGPSTLRRFRLPVYGTSVFTTPHVFVDGPDPFLEKQLFEWENYETMPRYMPKITISVPRNQRLYEARALPVPRYEVQFTRGSYSPRGPGRPGEPHRRRQDQKITHGWNRYYTLLRKYGSIEEVGDAWMAINAANGNPFLAGYYLAMNQAFDYSVGIQNRMIKRHVYQKQFYKLPFGLRTGGWLYSG